MRPWHMKLNIPKSRRYKTNEDYLKILRLVAEEIDEQSQPKENNDNEL